MNIIPNRDSPKFNEIDSTPEELGEYHLKLCFCPFCENGIKILGFDKEEKKNGMISWQLICRCIMYSLTTMYAPRVYFSLKKDIYWWIVDHWYCFGTFKQFKTNPSKWKKSLLDALSHSTYFENGTNSLKKTGMWKLTDFSNPWEEKITNKNSNQINKFEQDKNIDEIDKKNKIKIECLNGMKYYHEIINCLENEMKKGNLNNEMIQQLIEMKEVLKQIHSLSNNIENKEDNHSFVLLNSMSNNNV